MNIIAVDDERRALRTLSDAIKRVVGSANIFGFMEAEAALAYARENRVDIAFLDIRLGGQSGLILAKQLKDIYGKTNIIFVTSYSEYANNAFGLRASGYILKPIKPSQVLEELNHLRFPVEWSQTGVHFHCFGSFEVYVDGKPIHFGRSKSKELLAFLVDRKGAGVTRKKLAAVLWEDESYTRPRQKQLQNLIDEMKRALKVAGAHDDIVQIEKGVLWVSVDLVTCDYYSFINGDVDAVNSYYGEYMSEYSWAEFTAGALSQKLTLN